MLIFIKPAFTALWLNQYLEFDLKTNWFLYAIYGAFALVLGIVAGFYPAMHLSRFQPVKAIQNSASMPTRRFGIRKVLSVGQFVISLFFIITSILVYTQFRYFMNFEYGFSPKDVVNIELQGNNFRRVSEAFNSIQGVSAISASEYIPATGRTSGMDLKKPDTGEVINFRLLSADENFIGNMGLQLVAGTNIAETSDSAGTQIVLNEAAVKALGFQSAEEAVGQILIISWKNEPVQVTGVVQDFWLKLPIGGERLEPAYLRNDPKRFSYANLKITGADVPAAIKSLELKWKSIDPIHPFKYQFYENELASTHAGIFDVVSIVGSLAFIAITIACLGMLGMATYTTERKKKEVGMGASSSLTKKDAFRRPLINN